MVNQFRASRTAAIAAIIMVSFMATTMLATTHTVNFGGSLGLVFSPSSFSAQVGDTVTWLGDFTMHSTTSTTIPAGAASWNHGVGGTGAGTSFSYVITVVGTYNYHCSVHASLGMVGSFTVTASGLPAPPLSSPSNGSVNQATSLAISWGTVTGATSYSAQVSTASDFSTTLFNTGGITAVSVTVSGLANGTTCYWRANASNAGGAGPWSDVWSFTTIPLPPGAPALSTPSNGATGQSTALTFSWNTVSGTVASYTVQVSTGSTFSNSLFTQTGTGRTAAVTGLSYGGITYFWRAGSTNAGGTTWSSVWSFSTLNVPAAPTLSSPANGGSFTNGSSISLVWAATATATSYSVQLSTSSIFSSTVVSPSGLTSVSYQATPAQGVKNYWRVSATNAAGTGAWSSVWTLTPPVSATKISVLNGNHAFSIKNGAIAYSLPVAERVEISLCDILGKRVMTISRLQASGSYSLNLKESMLGPGFYIMRFAAGSFMVHKKLSLIN